MKPWWKTRQEERERERQEKREKAKERAKETRERKKAEYNSLSDEDKAKVDAFNEKKRIVSKINSRMRKTVDKFGTEQREYSKFLGRIQASSTLETSTSYTYEMILDRQGNYKGSFAMGNYDGTDKEEVEYALLSSSAEDIEKYSLEELQRLERNTKTLSQVRSSFVQSVDAGSDLSDKEIRRVMNIRHLVTQAMEANSDLWYELLDETGWSGDEARQKSTEEIYQQLVKQRAINLPHGRMEFSLLGNSDEEAHQKYLQFKNARKIQEEMSSADSIGTDGSVQRVHYEKW